MAQLGARFHGMEEVDGSNPSRSTSTLQTFKPCLHHIRASSFLVHCGLPPSTSINQSDIARR